MPKFPELSMGPFRLPFPCIVACVAFLHAAEAHAQVSERTSELPVEWITVDDGLPQGMVRAILQDRTGYMWFATKDGLARSDGYGYTVFRHDAQDSLSICANHISCLYESRAGDLWIGSEGGAVDRYDPRTGVFTHVLRPDPGTPGVSQTIRQFAEDRKGNMIALGAQGIAFVVAHASDSTAYQLAEKIVAVVFAPNNELWTLAADELVISTLNGDLSRTVLKRIALPPLAPTIAGLIADTLGSRMLMVRQGSIITFDPASHTAVDTIIAKGVENDPGLYLLDGDHLWLGYGGSAHATRISLKTGVMEPITFTAVNGGSLPQGAIVVSFARDRSGNLWVGTSGYGVFLHRALAGRFHQMLQGSSSLLVKADREGDHLVAAERMLWINPPDGVPKETGFGRALNEAGRIPSWYGMIRDGSGVWWSCITVLENGNHLMYHGPGEEDGLHTMPLGSDEEPLMLINCDSKELWILANGSAGSACDRLIRFDPITRRITGRHMLPFPLPVSDYRIVSALLLAGDGTLWLGTRKGLLELRPGSEKWVVHTHDPRDPNSLPSDRIFSLCFDPDTPDGSIWVGTEDAGMARMDMRSGACRNFSINDGLPNNTIYAILADTHRNLWMSTNKGLCRFDPRTGATRIYSRNDGLAGTEFNRHSAAIAHDGRFFFAGTNGITYFHPDEMYGDASPSATVITGLGLANKQVQWNNPRAAEDKAFFIPSPPDHLQSLSLPYAERSLTISFACMDHSTPLKNSFRYKLDGFHHEWVDAGTAHEATFTNLDPGTYTFRVQGRNSAEVWDEQGDALELIIAPPWWGTWWFRGLVVLAIGGGLYGFYRYRLAQAMKVAAVRERIARDLHDEIGSTLSSVSLYSSVAQKKVADKAPEANELLGRISESTTQVLESINDIVWAVNADNDDMDHLVKRMHDYAVRMAETRECALRFDHDPALRSVQLDMSARKNLYLIFKEAVNNAVKYSGSRELRVSLKRERSELVMRIGDDGKGFDQLAEPSTGGGGNGLPNMRKRAAELGATFGITSAAGKGTTVELRFTPGSRAKSLEAMTDRSNRAE
jgi:signal transduction histidine kinase/ligand-binding sensor domain-containing protein